MFGLNMANADSVENIKIRKSTSLQAIKTREKKSSELLVFSSYDVLHSETIIFNLAFVFERLPSLPDMMLRLFS